MAVLGTHPCLVRYHTSWIENKRTYIQMELCGKSLSHLIERKIKYQHEVIKKARGSSFLDLSLA